MNHDEHPIKIVKHYRHNENGLYTALLHGDVPLEDHESLLHLAQQYGVRALLDSLGDYEDFDREIMEVVDAIQTSARTPLNESMFGDDDRVVVSVPLTALTASLVGKVAERDLAEDGQDFNGDVWEAGSDLRDKVLEIPGMREIVLGVVQNQADSAWGDYISQVAEGTLFDLNDDQIEALFDIYKRDFGG